MSNSIPQNYRIKLSTIAFFLLLLMYKLLLDLSYIFVVSPSYTYMGLKLQINTIKMVESYMLLVLLFAYIGSKIRQPSDVLIKGFFFLLLIIPTLSYYGLADQSRAFTYMILSSFVLCEFVTQVKFNFDVKLRFRTINPLYPALLFFATTAVFIWIVASGGLEYINIDFSKVYANRIPAIESIDAGVFTYLILWTYKVACPGLLGWGIYKKNTLVIITGLTLLVFFFATSNHKAILFYPLLVFVIYFVTRSHLNRALIKLLCMFMFVLISSSFLGFILQTDVFGLHIDRRVFFIPTYLMYLYYETFSVDGHVYMADTVINRAFLFSNEVDPAAIIGEKIFGRPANAGSGFIGNAYAELGYIGILLFSVIAGLLLRLINTLWNKNHPLWLPLSITAVPFITMFLNAGLFVSLFSHGILFSYIALFLLRGEKIQPYK